MNALRAELSDYITHDEEGAFSPHDPAFKRAVDAVFDLDDQGRRLDLEISDKPYEALIRISQELHNFGVANNLANEFVEAIEAQAVHLGVDFTKKEKPTPMTIALRVVDEEPVLDPGKTHFMVAWDRDGKHGGEYSQMLMKLGINGTQSSHTNVPKFEELFAAGKKQYLIAHFEKLEGEGVGSLDQAGVAMATLVEAVGAAAAESRGAAEIKQTIEVGTIKPEIMQLIDSVATLNHLAVVAQTPQAPAQTAPRIAEVKNQIVNLTSAISKTDAIPSVVAKAVVKAYEKTDAAPAAAAPQKANAEMAANSNLVSITAAKSLQAPTIVQPAANQQAAPVTVDAKQSAPVEGVKQAQTVTATQAVPSQPSAPQAQAPVQSSPVSVVAAAAPVAQSAQPHVQAPVHAQAVPVTPDVKQVAPIESARQAPTVTAAQPAPSQPTTPQAQAPMQASPASVVAAATPVVQSVQPHVQVLVQPVIMTPAAQIAQPHAQTSFQQQPQLAQPVTPALQPKNPDPLPPTHSAPKDTPLPVRQDAERQIVTDGSKQIFEAPKSPQDQYTRHETSGFETQKAAPQQLKQDAAVPYISHERAEAPRRSYSDAAPTQPPQESFRHDPRPDFARQEYRSPEPAPFQPVRETFFVTKDRVEPMPENHNSALKTVYTATPHETPSIFRAVTTHDNKISVEPVVGKTPSSHEYTRVAETKPAISLRKEFKSACDGCADKGVACATCNRKAATTFTFG